VTDASLNPDPDRKGSYYRRIEDIRRAFDTLGVAKLAPAPRFIAYFFGCEKLAHGVVGIVSSRPADNQYHHRNRLQLNDIKTAAGTMKLSIAPSDLEWIFAEPREHHLLAGGLASASARVLRNKLIHDLDQPTPKSLSAPRPY
jgi:hypothetical protein